MHPSRSARSLALVVAALAAACSAPPTTSAPSSSVTVPARFVGLSDIVGKVTVANGTVDASRLGIEWANVDRREVGREPEHGLVSDIAPDGSFRIPALPFGTYSLTVKYADGRARDLRVIADEDQEQVDVALPAGQLAVHAAPGHELYTVNVRPFGSSTALLAADSRHLNPEGVVADGLGPGRYVVDAIFKDHSKTSVTVSLGDNESRELEVAPDPRQPVAVRWSGDFPDHSERSALVIEAYGCADDDRLYDFGSQRVSCRVDPDGDNIWAPKRSTIDLPEGRHGLLMLLRDNSQSAVSLLAWVPEVDVKHDAAPAVQVPMPRLREVAVRTASGQQAPPSRWSVRLGDDVVPASVLFDSRFTADPRHPLRLPVGAKVVSGPARRRGPEDGGAAVAVENGSGVQEIVVAD